MRVPFHVGYVVSDLDAAMQDYGAAAGLTWARVTPRPVRVRVDEGSDPVSVDLLATYSQQGPPYVELIQEVRGGVWTDGPRGPRLDHLGYWCTDLAAETRRLLEQPGTASVLAVDPMGQPTRFAYLRPPSGGPWVELVDERVKPDLLAWVAGQVYQVR